MSERYEYIVKGYWANVVWAEFDKELITKGVCGMTTKVLTGKDKEKAEMDVKLNKEAEREEERKSINLNKVLDILHDARQMNDCMGIVLRADGTFASANGNYVSPIEMLQKYHKLAKQVEQAHNYLHNSIKVYQHG